MKKQIKKLATMLGIGAIDGSIAISAVTGLFKQENILVIAFLFLAGPAAIITASLLEGSIRERMFVALISGALATIIVMFAAGLGPVLLEHINLNVMKITGGIALIAIALLVMGFKIPENTPFVIVLLGLIGGVLLR